MSAPRIRVSKEWLALREPADAAARARDLAAYLGRQPPATGRWEIHDLGGGTGAMGRWLAPLLPGAQHWLVHDLDSDLLDVAADNVLGPSADGEAVTVEAKQSDVTRLAPHELTGADLITASAILDLLTGDELSALLTLCTGAGCPILLTLSVVGRVDLVPVEALDRRIAAAFDAHQRRETDRGRLLGPDAVTRAVAHSERVGAEILLRPSPWRLGAGEAALAAEWCRERVAAACEQQPELTADAEAYIRRRLAQAAAGQLAVTVDHTDLLVIPGSTPSSSR